MSFLTVLAFFKNPKVLAGIAALLLLGGTEERNTQLENTIKNVEKADEAREDIARPGPVGDRTRYDQCLRTARTPSNCERFMPNVQEDQR